MKIIAYIDYKQTALINDLQSQLMANNCLLKLYKYYKNIFIYNIYASTL